MQFKRLLIKQIQEHLKRSKSILLLGPRQVGKTTLIEGLRPALSFSLLEVGLRQRYEKSPDQLYTQIETLAKTQPFPLVVVDEIQLVPILMDVVQRLIDKKIAQFILTGSSARKLKDGQNINLLPGRVVVLYLDPLSYEESLDCSCSLEDRLLYGALPAIIQEENHAYQESDLVSYVETYLEEEVRREALVRNIASFSRFLELAAAQAGEIINLTKLSQEIGVAHSSIATYYQILEDCLIARRVDPYSESKARRRLVQAPKYLLFDLGVRRVAAREGSVLPTTVMGKLLEQWVGLELIKNIHLSEPRAQLYFWRDRNGIEVDWVIKRHTQLIPIEVKWTDMPTENDLKHLKIFMREYGVSQAYVVCRTPYRLEQKGIVILPWQNVGEIVSGIIC